MRQVYFFMPGRDPVLLGSLEEFLNIAIEDKMDRDFGVAEIVIEGLKVYIANDESAMWMYAGECNALRDDYRPSK